MRRCRAKLNAKRSKPFPNYRSGDRIWLKDAMGFFPEGIYTFLRRENGVVHIEGERVKAGLSESAIAFSRLLRPDEQHLPRVTDCEFARLSLERARENGEPECPHCRELVARGAEPGGPADQVH